MVADFTEQTIATAAAEQAGYDQDGDGIAFPFYDQLSNSLAFNDTIMNHIHGQPIGTMGDITGNNLHIVNSSFSGLEAGEHAVFGQPGQQARFSNLVFEDAHGTVTINGIGDNIQVASGRMTLQLGPNSQLNNTQMGKDSRIALITGNNVISNANIDGAVCDSSSDLSHGRFRGGSINATFDNVNAIGTEFNNVYLAGDIAGNFCGANFRNGALAVQSPHLMEVSDATTFHRMQVCELIPGQEPRWSEVNDLTGFRDIQSRSAARAAALDAGATLCQAINQLNERQPEPSQASLSASQAFELLGAPTSTVELRQSATAIANPGAMMTGDATEAGQAARGGDTPVNDNTPTRFAVADTSLNEQQSQGAQPVSNTDMEAARAAAIAHAESLDQGWIRG